MGSAVIDRWHKVVESKDLSALDTLLADEVTFYSPVVHTPQVGKAITSMYLTAASRTLFNGSFEYVREIVGEFDAMLEFNVELDGIMVNGVDLIDWNGNGQITAFKVLIRPLKGINAVHAAMGAELQRMQRQGE